MESSKSKVKVEFEGRQYLFLVGKTSDFSTLTINSNGQLIEPKKGVFFHIIKRGDRFVRMWGFIRVEDDFVNFVAIGRESIKINSKSKKLFEEFQYMLKMANEVTPTDLEHDLKLEKSKA